MTGREKWGYIFWGILGLLVAVTEILSVPGTLLPFPTLSTTIAHLEQIHDWVRIVVLGGIVMMAGRITLYPWPLNNE